jgi:hypothetical protein
MTEDKPKTSYEELRDTISQLIQTQRSEIEAAQEYVDRLMNVQNYIIAKQDSEEMSKQLLGPKKE